ncbi:MAG TPA: DNA mismatch repair protein MutS, partial [Chloroflexota bacterium]|nr:DNA mismatch repair protein MutS [Chloroflexota bacterium]
MKTPITTPSSPSDASRSDGRDTPIRRQFEALKAQHPSCILLFQLGDFYESFEDDARIVSRVCGVTLTSREFGKADRVPLAGVPLTRLDHYLATLLEAGLHVAVAEQVSPPGSGLVERVVTRVVTPGTICEPALLRQKENNYLAALVRGRNAVGLAYVDVTTGEFAVTQSGGDDVDTNLRAELERLGPAELLVPDGQEDPSPLIGHRTVCPAWRFAESAARERLCRQLNTLSLEGFGCAHLSLAIRAAGAILSYLEENNRRILPSLTGLRTYASGSGLLLDSYTRRNLDLLRNSRTGRSEGSLLAVLDRTNTPMGGRLLRRWLGQPLLDPVEIAARLDAVETFVRRDALRAQIRGALRRVGDLERQVGRVVQGLASPRELLGLAAALRTAGTLAGLVRELDAEDPKEECGPLDCCPGVVELIDAGVAEPGSGRMIRQGYDERLDTLVLVAGQTRRRIAELERAERERTGIKSLKIGYNKVFGYYLEVTRPNLPAVPAEYRRKQTLVQAERFITPDLKEWEDEILEAE